MSDRITLTRVRDSSPSKIATWPTEVLARIARDVDDVRQYVADLDANLSAALDLRFGERARDLRIAAGKDSGRVRLDDGDFVIVADQPKRVEWHQQQLAAVIARIRDGGDDPAEYVKTKLDVSERTYTAWPQRIRAIFESARTVKLGKPSYAIERRQEEAA